MDVIALVDPLISQISPDTMTEFLLNPLTTVMLLGNQSDNQLAAIDLLEKAGGTNFILAPGCDMPYDVPRGNLIGKGQAVQNIGSTKKFLQNYSKESADIEVEMPDYDNLEKPLLEIFTVDSTTCAACGYMTAAAMEMNNFYER